MSEISSTGSKSNNQHNDIESVLRKTQSRDKEGSGWV
jgi:hypothetical protein